MSVRRSLEGLMTTAALLGIIVGTFVAVYQALEWHRATVLYNHEVVIRELRQHAAYERARDKRWEERVEAIAHEVLERATAIEKGRD